MKPLGLDGQELPMPPEMMVPWRTRLVAFVSQSVGVAAAVLVATLLSVVGSYRSILESGWLEIGRCAVLGIAVSLGTGVLAIGACSLIALAFWPWTRRDFGRKLERQVAGLGADQLAEEIEGARFALHATTDLRQRTAWAEWLDWLEAHRLARPRACANPAPPQIEAWTVKPAISPQVLMACIGAPFLALAVWVTVDAIAERTLSWTTAGSVLGVSALGAWLLGEISTMRIHLTGQELMMRKFWRTNWSVARDRAELREGMVGDGASLPGYRVFDTATGKQVGAIVGGQFRAADLETLAAMFPQGR